MGVENTFEMLMYHVYIPLLQPFSPCLALARVTLNRLYDPLTKSGILRSASLPYYWYCLCRCVLVQIICEVLSAALKPLVFVAEDFRAHLLHIFVLLKWIMDS